MHYQEKLEILELALSTDDQAINWLKGNVPDKNSGIPFSRSRKVIEYLFFRRPNAAVKFAVARYACSEPFLNRIYKTADDSTRLAILRNDYVPIEEEQIVKLIEDFSKNSMLIQAYFENAGANRFTLASVIKRENEFSNICLDSLCYIVACLSNNPKITEVEASPFFEMYPGNRFYKLNDAILSLFEDAPADEAWARTLTPFAEKMSTEYSWRNCLN
jgi:hypothetical protein